LICQGKNFKENVYYRDDGWNLLLKLIRPMPSPRPSLLKKTIVCHLATTALKEFLPAVI
jgi:hypothetical protein